jgi:hypothetical protein
MPPHAFLSVLFASSRVSDVPHGVVSGVPHAWHDKPGCHVAGLSFLSFLSVRDSQLIASEA